MRMNSTYTTSGHSIFTGPIIMYNGSLHAKMVSTSYSLTKSCVHGAVEGASRSQMRASVFPCFTVLTLTTKQSIFSQSRIPLSPKHHTYKVEQSISLMKLFKPVYTSKTSASTHTRQMHPCHLLQLLSGPEVR